EEDCMRAVVATILCALVLTLRSMAVAAEAPVATVGNRQITRAELENHVRAKLIELDSQRYDALRDGLDEMVAEERLSQEAKARGVTVEVLTQQEVVAKVAAPTDAEIQQVYDANKEQLGGAPLDSVKSQIVDYLKQQKTADRMQVYVAELKKKYKTTV